MNVNEVGNSHVFRLPFGLTSNFDVILVRSDGVLRPATGHHVGNSRLQATLNLYKERYCQAFLFGNESECHHIAIEVMFVTCRQSTPNGRFLECCQGSLVELTNSVVVAFIRTCLQPTEELQEPEPKRVCRHITQDLLDSYDVICEESELELKPDCEHVGNNRLKVLVDIRMEKYMRSDVDNKLKIVEEVVEAIIDCSGHFLKLDQSSGKYTCISKEEATICVKNAFMKQNESMNGRSSFLQPLVPQMKRKVELQMIEHRRISVDAPFGSPVPTKLYSLPPKAA